MIDLRVVEMVLWTARKASTVKLLMKRNATPQRGKSFLWLKALAGLMLAAPVAALAAFAALARQLQTKEKAI